MNDTVFYKSKYVLGIILFTVAGILFINQYAFLDFPNSADEYAYQIMARTFLEGKLSVPSPPLKEFFDFIHIINDGKFYGKYSPGWPFFLMFGFLIGVPMVVNLIFSLLSIVVVFLIAKELFSDRVAKITIMLMAVSPYFLFNSATYYAQPSVFFFLSLFTYSYVKGSATGKAVYFLTQGILLGIIFNIRQFDAVIIGAGFLVYEVAGIAAGRKTFREVIRNAALAAAPALVLSSIFFYYNYVQTGDPLLTPFLKYDPNDRPGFSTGRWNSLAWAVEYNIFYRLFRLNLWMPFCLLLIPATFIFSRKEERIQVLLLLIIPTSYLFGYFFFAAFEWNSYGPRYIYPSSFAVFILMALGLERLSSWKKPLKFAVVPIILLCIALTAVHVFLMHEKTLERTAVYSEVDYLSVTNAIVFLAETDTDCSGNIPCGDLIRDGVSPTDCSGDMPCGDLTRNGISFDNLVLYVHYRGAEQNLRLMKRFPERAYYYWHCDKIGLEKIPVLNFIRAKNEHCLLIKIDYLEVEERVKEYKLNKGERGAFN
jgi:4-amino-4-deoxy-L-arabinose transferase-like glycosyltransferase